MPFFRAISGFLIQFGITPDREKARYWNDAGTIADDPRMPSQPVFTDGVVSFAGYAKDSRSTHLFITLGTQPSLGKRPWEVPVGVITSGIDVVHNIYTGYGDRVDQGRLSPERAGAVDGERCCGAEERAREHQRVGSPAHPAPSKNILGEGDSATACGSLGAHAARQQQSPQHRAHAEGAHASIESTAAGVTSTQCRHVYKTLSGHGATHSRSSSWRSGIVLGMPTGPGAASGSSEVGASPI